jgi:hypothetical protein
VKINVKKTSVPHEILGKFGAARCAPLWKWPASRTYGPRASEATTRRTSSRRP